MPKDTDHSPAEMGFNKADIQQIVQGMFDENKTPATAIKVEGHGCVLEITFSNKNANGSCKTEKRVLATNEAADLATQFANEKISSARGSFSFDAPLPRTSPTSVL